VQPEGETQEGFMAARGLQHYSVLKGRAIDQRQGSGGSPHFQILVVDDADRYRIAINVQSQDGSEVLYLVRSQFRHPITDLLHPLSPGLHKAESKPGGLALDYIRSNLLQPSEMQPLPIVAAGPDNDLNEKIGQYVQRALSDEAAMVYAFGDAWGPEANKRDQYFGFLPGHGIHDIHMNQGNPKGSHDSDNGVYQDGGLIFEFPRQQQWVAMFLKFRTQGWHTDDQTGNVLDLMGSGPPSDQPAEPGVIPHNHVPTADRPDGLVRIAAALVNDVTTPEHETVTLLNTSHQDVDLSGWSLKDKMKAATPLSGVLKAGETLRVDVKAPMTLSNKGGIITLLDDRGVKVHGVAYTREQASHPGQTVAFAS
jgi:uncharacterized protein YukJ